MSTEEVPHFFHVDGVPWVAARVIARRLARFTRSLLLALTLVNDTNVCVSALELFLRGTLAALEQK